MNSIYNVTEFNQEHDIFYYFSYNYNEKTNRIFNFINLACANYNRTSLPIELDWFFIAAEKQKEDDYEIVYNLYLINVTNNIFIEKIKEKVVIDNKNDKSKITKEIKERVAKLLLTYREVLTRDINKSDLILYYKPVKYNYSDSVFYFPDFYSSDWKYVSNNLLYYRAHIDISGYSKILVYADNFQEIKQYQVNYNKNIITSENMKRSEVIFLFLDKDGRNPDYYYISSIQKMKKLLNKYNKKAYNIKNIIIANHNRTSNSLQQIIILFYIIDSGLYKKLIKHNYTSELTYHVVNVRMLPDRDKNNMFYDMYIYCYDETYYFIVGASISFNGITYKKDNLFCAIRITQYKDINVFYSGEIFITPRFMSGNMVHDNIENYKNFLILRAGGEYLMKTITYKFASTYILHTAINKIKKQKTRIFISYEDCNKENQNDFEQTKNKVISDIQSLLEEYLLDRKKTTIISIKQSEYMNNLLVDDVNKNSILNILQYNKVNLDKGRYLEIYNFDFIVGPYEVMHGLQEKLIENKTIKIHYDTAYRHTIENISIGDRRLITTDIFVYFITRYE